VADESGLLFQPGPEACQPVGSVDNADNDAVHAYIDVDRFFRNVCIQISLVWMEELTWIPLLLF